MAVTVTRWDDPARWNAFVARTPFAHFQQSWEWGELAPLLGGRAVRLAALRDGKQAGAMQLFVNPISRTGWTQLYVPRGPALAAPSLELMGPLIDAARTLGMEERAIGLRLEPGAPDCSTAWKEPLAALGLRPVHPPTQPRSSWLLDLQASEDELLAAMKPKTRYNIRLAARKGVEVREGTPHDFEAFYRLYRDTAARDDFFVQPAEFYRTMFDLFWRAGTFTLLLGMYQDDLIAAVTLLRLGTTCWYVHGASSSTHRNVMAPHLLQWEAIRRARAAGCTLYDFRAVPDVLRESEDMFGVYRFKEGFGGYHFTALPMYATAYRAWPFALWQSFFAGRFALDAWRRRRAGLPARQFA